LLVTIFFPSNQPSLLTAADINSPHTMHTQLQCYKVFTAKCIGNNPPWLSHERMLSVSNKSHTRCKNLPHQYCK